MHTIPPASLRRRAGQTRGAVAAEAASGASAICLPVRCPDAGPASFLQAFRRRLAELGYREGRNVIIEAREAGGDFARLPRLAAELASLAPDVIVAAATSAALAIQRTTLSIPIVIASAADPVANGFVKSLVRPGGNITGLSNMAPDLTARTVDVLRALAPAARRIAVLMSANPSHLGVLRDARAAAQTFGAKVDAHGRCARRSGRGLRDYGEAEVRRPGRSGRRVST